MLNVIIRLIVVWLLMPIWIQATFRANAAMLITSNADIFLSADKCPTSLTAPKECRLFGSISHRFLSGDAVITTSQLGEVTLPADAVRSVISEGESSRYMPFGTWFAVACIFAIAGMYFSLVALILAPILAPAWTWLRGVRTTAQ